MAELKTRPTKASVADYLAKISDAGMRADAKRVSAMMKKATGAKPEMWGDSIVGFGRFQYRKDGTEWMILGFAPRKGKLTLYLWAMWQEQKLLAEMGNPKCGMGCLYLKRLEDVDQRLLEKLVRASVKRARTFEPK